MTLPLILHLSQDDPKKCSARKMVRLGKAKMVEHFHDIPHKYLLLDPFTKVALSPADRAFFDKRGIAAIDCSWEEAERVFKKFREVRKVHSRALPLLMAVNPVKFGKWGELSTLEALAASYFILGMKDQAADMMSIYTWGENFIKINKEPLEAYAACRDSTEVVEVQKEFL